MIQNREAQYGLVFDRPDYSVTLAMPIPFAICTTSGAFTSYAVPAVGGRVGAGMGLTLVPDLVVVLRQPQDADAARLVIRQSYGPEALQSVGDIIRKLVSGVDVDRQELISNMEFLDRVRREQLQQAMCRFNRAYNMTYLVQCLVLSGFLLNAHDIKPAVVICIAIILGPESSLREHFEKLFSHARSVPSPTTIYRHRLTMHIAFCKVLQYRYQEMLSDPAGIVSWGTLDKSPNRGWDFVLCGFATMPASTLVQAFLNLNFIISEKNRKQKKKQENKQKQNKQKNKQK